MGYAYSKSEQPGRHCTLLLTQADSVVVEQKGEIDLKKLEIENEVQRVRDMMLKIQGRTDSNHNNIPSMPEISGKSAASQSYFRPPENIRPESTPKQRRPEEKEERRAEKRDSSREKERHHRDRSRTKKRSKRRDNSSSQSRSAKSKHKVKKERKTSKKEKKQKPAEANDAEKEIKKDKKSKSKKKRKVSVSSSYEKRDSSSLSSD
jgi:hypothetical protein